MRAMPTVTDVFTSRMNKSRPNDGGASSDVPGEGTDFTADRWWKRFELWAWEQQELGKEEELHILLTPEGFIRRCHEILADPGPAVGTAPKGWLHHVSQKPPTDLLPSGVGTNFFADSIYTRSPIAYQPRKR